MHAPPKPHISRHRHARILSWTLMLLLWLARALNTEKAPTLRHLLRRYGWIFHLDRLARHVANLIVLRAAAILQLRRRRPPAVVRYGGTLARPGFMRSVIGARLRRSLKHRDIAARIAILIDTLNRIDALAVAFARRLRRRLTKLWAILPALGAAVPLPPRALSAPAAADTS